ncbi:MULTISPECIES: DinB family protein [Flammeovirga]|uniref:DinB family protein n=1 Tax=Flammeovirga agarivorans TaxID=2726742 RepID=A0A7X8SNY3_9BACT|nr:MULTISPECIES: DinB family protein [Flammeovirga]NLR93720.1 DinB family protein [Flammeovirga agarivorans]
MKKKDIPFMPEFYDRYINLCEDKDVVDVLSETLVNINMDNVEKMRELGTRVYATGKWTMHDIIQHIIDTERILAYRALRFAREDKTEIEGFEENAYAVTALGYQRDFDELVAEFQAVRMGTIAMFKSFTDEMLLQEGVASGIKNNVLAIGFTIAGHQLHHGNVIKERYFPLLDQ